MICLSKTILTVDECEQVLNAQEVGFLSLSRGNQPYCIPFNFVYDEGSIYIHTGLKGLKWEYLGANPRVCFTVASTGVKKSGDSPCQYTYQFESVIITGSAVEVSLEQELREALSKLIDKYRVAPVTPVPEDTLKKLKMIRIDIENISGRKNV